MLRTGAVAILGLFLLLGLIVPVGPARAQDQTEILANQAAVHFPDKIIFSLEVAGAEKVTEVKLLYGTDGRTCQSGRASQSLDFEVNRILKASWTWELQRSGALPIGTQIWWQWELYDAEGIIASTEAQRLTIEDPRHSWKTLESEEIRVYWYAGERSFGAELLQIAQESLKRLESEMGVSMPDRVEIIVYPTVYELQEALIVAADWTGAVAFTDYNSMIVAIAPEEIEWAREVIPHELAHLVTEVRILNCRGGWMPTWLSEGLATLAMEHYLDRSIVRQETLDNLPRSSLTHAAGAKKKLRVEDPQALIVQYVRGYWLTRHIEETQPQLLIDLLSERHRREELEEKVASVFGKAPEDFWKSVDEELRSVWEKSVLTSAST